MTTERVASDHASQEVPREIILPTPCSCSLVPDVTTPLYSTTVSKALRNALRGRSFRDVSAHSESGARSGCTLPTTVQLRWSPLFPVYSIPHVPYELSGC